MMIYNYQYIEELLLRLLGLLACVFTDSERNEIQECIGAGEYGLALETLVDIINEENKQIPKEALKLVYELAEMMQLATEDFKKKLQGHIIDG